MEVNFGHKISFCKNFFNNNWYEFNDNSKYYIKYQNEILNLKPAFLLVYEINQNKLDNIEGIKKVCDKNYSNNFSYLFYNNIKNKKRNKKKIIIIIIIILMNIIIMIIMIIIIMIIIINIISIVIMIQFNKKDKINNLSFIKK
jgi:hypothetical protein